MISDDPQLSEFLDNLGEKDVEEVCREFANDLTTNGYDLRSIEYNKSRSDSDYLDWLRQQSMAIFDVPFVKKDGENVFHIPILIVFEQFRIDFSYLVENIFKIYIRDVLNQNHGDFTLRTMFKRIIY